MVNNYPNLLSLFLQFLNQWDLAAKQDNLSLCTEDDAEEVFATCAHSGLSP